jgi:hypothetical protein
MERNKLADDLERTNETPDADHRKDAIKCIRKEENSIP